MYWFGSARRWRSGPRRKMLAMSFFPGSAFLGRTEVQRAGAALAGVWLAPAKEPVPGRGDAPVRKIRELAQSGNVVEPPHQPEDRHQQQRAGDRLGPLVGPAVGEPQVHRLESLFLRDGIALQQARRVQIDRLDAAPRQTLELAAAARAEDAFSVIQCNRLVQGRAS